MFTYLYILPTIGLTSRSLFVVQRYAKSNIRCFPLIARQPIRHIRNSTKTSKYKVKVSSQISVKEIYISDNLTKKISPLRYHTDIQKQSSIHKHMYSSHVHSEITPPFIQPPPRKTKIPNTLPTTYIHTYTYLIHDGRKHSHSTD